MRRSLQAEILAAAALVHLASRTTCAEPAPMPQRAPRRAEPPDAPATYREPKRKAQWKSETYGRRQK